VPDSTRFVGLDVHRDTVAIAIVPVQGDLEFAGELPNDLTKLRRFFEKLRAKHPVRACYEAGCCGYVLQRAMTSWGIPCEVIAPSLIPTRPGDLRKTDARDARGLALSYRAGLLTAVRVPGEDEERVRGLTRAREALKQDAHETRQHILKFLLLRGHVYRGGKKAWTRGFFTWLRALLPTLDPVDGLVLTTHISLLEHKHLLRATLDQKIEEVSRQEPYREPVARLRCLRGVDTLTALSLLVEIGDARRFETPRRLMGYLGLTVSERSSGATQRRGGITKSGNSRCRRLLVEAAWNYRHAPKDSIKIRARREGQPPDVLACAVRAQRRLNARFVRLLERMPSQKAVTAVARELVGFVWAMLQGTPTALLAPKTR
jgi:transposase